MGYIASGHLREFFPWLVHEDLPLSARVAPGAILISPLAAGDHWDYRRGRVRARRGGWFEVIDFRRREQRTGVRAHSVFQTQSLVIATVYARALSYTDTVERVQRIFARFGFPCVVTSGDIVDLYGVAALQLPRWLGITVPPKAGRHRDALTALGARSDPVRSWRSLQLGFWWDHVTIKYDVPTATFAGIAARARRIRIGSTVIPVISPEDLIVELMTRCDDPLYFLPDIRAVLSGTPDVSVDTVLDLLRVHPRKHRRAIAAAHQMLMKHSTATDILSS